MSTQHEKALRMQKRLQAIEENAEKALESLHYLNERLHDIIAGDQTSNSLLDETLLRLYRIRDDLREQADHVIGIFGD